MSLDLGASFRDGVVEALLEEWSPFVCGDSGDYREVSMLAWSMHLDLLIVCVSFDHKTGTGDAVS